MNIKITPDIFLQFIDNKIARERREFLASKPVMTDLVVSNKGAQIGYAGNFIKNVKFSEPQRLDTAIFILKNNPKISDEMYLLSNKVFNNLKNLGKELSKTDQFDEVKVVSLIGVGNKALAFETEDGKVLKFTNGNHFPDNRSQQEFDIPVEKSGKVLPDGKFYYYLEEKATEDNINASEVRALHRAAKKMGYHFVDYREEDLYCGAINFSQFGRGKNGKVYLLDPECAIKGGKFTFIKSLLKDLFRVW